MAETKRGPGLGLGSASGPGGTLPSVSASPSPLQNEDDGSSYHLGLFEALDRAERNAPAVDGLEIHLFSPSSELLRAPRP